MMAGDPTQPPVRPIDWGRSFFFFRGDPEWMTKIALGALFSLLSIVLIGAFFIGGYFLRLIASVARGADDRLPEWSDLGALFRDGAKFVGVYFLLTLPLSLVPAVLGCVVGLIGPLLGQGGNREAAAVVGVIGMALFVGLMLIWMVALYAVMFYLPAAFVRQAITGEFRAGFAFRENLAFMRRNLGQYLLALVIYLAAGIMATLGYLACCVGIFATTFWAVCVLSWGLGQVARRDPEMLELIAGGAARGWPQA